MLKCTIGPNRYCPCWMIFHKNYTKSFDLKMMTRSMLTLFLMFWIVTIFVVDVDFDNIA